MRKKLLRIKLDFVVEIDDPHSHLETGIGLLMNFPAMMRPFLLSGFKAIGLPVRVLPGGSYHIGVDNRKRSAAAGTS